MIETFSRHLAVRDAGRQVQLDLRALQDEMRVCCAAVGLPEGWLAEQVVAALDDSLLARPTAEPLLERADLDRLITRLLLAAGYGDVAAEFCRRRKQLPAILGSAPADPWDEARLRLLLARRLPVSTDILEALLRQTTDRLDRLGLTRITDDLIVELAAHLLREPGLVVPLPPDSPWLLLPEQVDAACRGIGARLRHQEILHLHPVSRLLPTVRLTLNLERLAVSLGNVPLTELEFWPALHKVTRTARRILETIRNALATGARVGPDLPARVLVAGLPALTQRYLGPLNRAASRRLAHDVEAAIRSEAADRSGFPVIVTLVNRSQVPPARR